MKLPDTTVTELAHYVNGLRSSALAPWAELLPWDITRRASDIVQWMLASLPAEEYRVVGHIAVHRSAAIEDGVVLKGPLIVGAHCLVAAGAYLRGGNWLSEGCVIGPGSELKSSFLFAGTKLAHFNYVGDSIIGADVNLEAGSIICNYRNEREDKALRVRVDGQWVRTGSEKFGALMGDGTRIGANAVVAPGAFIERRSVVQRGSLLDQDAGAEPD